MYICNHNKCIKNDWELTMHAMYIFNDDCMNDALYIIIIGMNAVNNLNFCLGYK